MRKSDLPFVAVILILILTLSVSSCGEEGPLQLNREDNKLVDSLFFASKDSIIKLTDSICEEKYSGMLARAIDSVKKVRREEIESILNRS